MRCFALLLSITTFAFVPSLARADAPPAAAPLPPTAPPRAPSPAPPSASPPLVASLSGGEDEVTLKNGGMIRGTVTELDPNKSVTIVVAGSGAARTLPWTEVDRVARNVHPVAPAAAPSEPLLHGAAPPLAPSELHANLPGFARIHVETPDPRVQLRRQLGTGKEVICRTPCDVVVDGRKGDEFYFGGSGLTSSAPFQLFDKQGELTADVQPGSSALKLDGYLALALGGAAMTLGGPFLAAGVSSSSVGGGSGNGMTAFGGVVLGAGAVAAIVGLVLLLSNGTTYDLHPTATIAPASPAAPRPPLPASEDTSHPTPSAGNPIPSTPPAAGAPASSAPPPPFQDALPADEDACRLAAEYDRRAAAATEPAKTQLLKIAAHRHWDCERQQHQ